MKLSAIGWRRLAGHRVFVFFGVVVVTLVAAAPVQGQTSVQGLGQPTNQFFISHADPERAGLWKRHLGESASRRREHLDCPGPPAVGVLKGVMDE